MTPAQRVETGCTVHAAVSPYGVVHYHCHELEAADGQRSRRLFMDGSRQDCEWFLETIVPLYLDAYEEYQAILTRVENMFTPPTHRATEVRAEVQNQVQLQ